MNAGILESLSIGGKTVLQMAGPGLMRTYVDDVMWQNVGSPPFGIVIASYLQKEAFGSLLTVPVGLLARETDIRA
jgi:hypothetical protein